MTTKTQRIDIGNLEGGSSDGFIDAVKGWLTQEAIDRNLAPYMELTADVTGSWDIPVKPEEFYWSHPIRTCDYTGTLDLYEVKREGKRLIAVYMIELTT